MLERKCKKKDLEVKITQEKPNTFPVKLFQANIHLFNVNKINTRKSCKICSKLTVKSP